MDGHLYLSGLYYRSLCPLDWIQMLPKCCSVFIKPVWLSVNCDLCYFPVLGETEASPP